MTDASPGWRIDPDDPRREKWWDGSRWTGRTRLRPVITSRSQAIRYFAGYGLVALGAVVTVVLFIVVRPDGAENWLVALPVLPGILVINNLWREIDRPRRRLLTSRAKRFRYAILSGTAELNSLKVLREAREELRKPRPGGHA
jgi:hypothetical protein